MWFDYEGDTVLLNITYKKVRVDRGQPAALFPSWSTRTTPTAGSVGTIRREILEDDPEQRPGRRQLDRIWTKYTGRDPPYGLRDPAIDERRVLFECSVDRVATFGQP